jgi:hypothetical protein
VNAVALPDWLPPAVAKQVRLIEARCLPADQQAILQRLVTDARMRNVWRELSRRKRPGGDFFTPANRPPDKPTLTQDEAQAEALGELFHFAFCAARDRVPVSKPNETADAKAKLLQNARMLREIADDPARTPGPLRAFFLQVRARRGQHVAAVATARKLAILVWHLLTKNESYLLARPALHARKLRDLELKAGYKPARGQKGAAHAYNIRSYREQERSFVEQAEAAYTRFVAGWNRRGPKPAPKARTGAANEERR